MKLPLADKILSFSEDCFSLRTQMVNSVDKVIISLQLVTKLVDISKSRVIALMDEIVDQGELVLGSWKTVQDTLRDGDKPRSG